MSNLQESMTGVSTVRGFNQQPRFERIICENLNKMSGCTQGVAATQACLLTYLNIVNVLLIFAVGIMVITPGSGVNPSVAGVILASSLGTLFSTQSATRYYNDVEDTLHAVERLCNYCHEVPVEANRYDPPGTVVHANWPSSGAVRFDKVEMRFAQESPLVLKSISFSVEPGEKVGIVGRTGAGKSSLCAALFRLVELQAGKVTIDGQDISKLGLETLRSRLSIVPQDPLLVIGDVRKNLDPTSRYSDAELLNALCKSRLAEVAVDQDGTSSHQGILLDHAVEANGENFSLGQRQQLSLARALLHRSQIVVLDEATSNIDPNLDADLQAEYANLFQNKTVISIAHRINTILRFDRIIVLDQGTIAEMGHPLELFDNDGIFRGMCRNADIDRAMIKLRIGRDD